MSASVFLLRFSTDSIVVFIIQSAIFKHNNILLVDLLMAIFFRKNPLKSLVIAVKR